jgi:hypothetical protein
MMARFLWEKLSKFVYCVHVLFTIPDVFFYKVEIDIEKPVNITENVCLFLIC